MSFDFENLVRESVTSLEVSARSDRRNSSEREGKPLYAVRPTRRFQF